MTLAMLECDPEVEHQNARGALHGIGTFPSSTEIIEHAPEMRLLREFEHGLLRTTGDMARDSEHLRTVVSQLSDPVNHLVLLLGEITQPGRHSCKTVADALARFGSDHVRSHVLATALTALAGSDDGSSRLRRRVWRHTIWVGLCSRLIAKRCGLPCHDTAFVAGLLHDIGYLLEERCAGAGLEEAARMASDGRAIVEAERMVLGFDHAELGARAFAACNLSTTIQSAAAFHHQSGGSSEDDLAITRCVEAANAVCTVKGIWSVARAAVTLPLGAMGNLGLGKGEVRVLAVELERQAVAFETLLNRPAG